MRSRTTSVKIYSVGIWNLEKGRSKYQELLVKIYSVGIWNPYFLFLMMRVSFVKIYSVGIWNSISPAYCISSISLKFIPLEFETSASKGSFCAADVKIYSVGIWNSLWRKPLCCNVVKIYSVGIWNIGNTNIVGNITTVKIYSVGIWNYTAMAFLPHSIQLKFIPLEFETPIPARNQICVFLLKFIPLEFETPSAVDICRALDS